MCALAIKSTTHSYSKLERVPCADLFVVERGVVAKSGRLGVAGACFGKDVILSNDSLRDLSDAIALTFVQTHTLTQDDIFGLLSEYPKVRATAPQTHATPNACGRTLLAPPPVCRPSVHARLYHVPRACHGRRTSSSVRRRCAWPW
jgi:hypothetical protein